jgi:hypothetical protein
MNNVVEAVIEQHDREHGGNYASRRK